MNGNDGCSSSRRQLVRNAKVSSGKILALAVAILFVLIDGKTPLAAKTLMTAAVVYFISPIDGLPDLMPLFGYVDDAAVVAGALAAIACFVGEEHKQQAHEILRRLWGS